MSRGGNSDAEFYVGYAASAPPGIVRRVRGVIVVMLIGCAAVTAALAMGFRTSGSGSLSMEPQVFVGQLIERPYPMLRMMRDGRVECVLLVGSGKYGAGPRVTARNGEVVSVWGTLLVRDGRRMVELADEPGPGRSAVVEGASADLPARIVREHQRVSLCGEIVDPKCYLGAMKPGDGKAHKGCAILCISGGIPPMLVAAGESQSNPSDSYYLLVDAVGGPLNKRVLPFVAEPVEVTGVVEEWDGLRVLRVDDDPAALQRR